MADEFDSTFPPEDYGNVSSEDVEALLRQQEEAQRAADEAARAAEQPGGEGGETTPLTETPPTGETPPPDGETPPPPPPPPTEAWTYDDGTTITREQAQGFARFRDYLAANPEQQQRVAALLQGEYDLVPRGSGTQTTEPPATSTPPAAPPNLDMDDPAIKYLWEQHVAQQATLEEQRQKFEALQGNFGEATEYLMRHEAQLTKQAEETTNSLINRGRTSYQQQHGLDDNQMQTVFETAGRLQVLPSLLAPTDPISGQPRRVDPLNAIEQSFDVALWSIPELRDRELNRVAEENRKDIEKKQKLTALGGSSGSVPRQPAVPTNPQEVRQAMVKEVAGYMEGKQE